MRLIGLERMAGNANSGTTREQRLARGDKLCGAKLRRSDQTCTMPAGWGTDHEGSGLCKHHLGNFKDQVVKSAIPYAEKMLGKPLDVSPHQALLAVVQYCASDVAWLNHLMKKVDADDPVVTTMFGKQMDTLFKERQSALFLLARVSKMALDAGVAERQIQLAENMGTLIAGALNGILAGLDLTAQQKERVPGLVRLNLAAIEGMTPEGALDVEEEPIEDAVVVPARRVVRRTKRRSGK